MTLFSTFLLSNIDSSLLFNYRFSNPAGSLYSALIKLST